jgi:pantetheine-phosphate adenylyltransferase
MKNRVVYPGTFDPLTCGHEDIVRRAAGLFGEVVVAVADNPGKKPLFSVHERVEMAAEVLSDCANVSVMAFSGLLMQFVRDQDSYVVLRGLRAASDFEFEFQLAGMNRKLYPEVETLFLTPANTCLFQPAWCGKSPCWVAMSASSWRRRSSSASSSGLAS